MATRRGSLARGLATVWIGLAILAGIGVACPFCGPLPGVPTVQSELVAYDHVVLARALATTSESAPELLIEDVLRGEGFAVGGRLTLRPSLTLESAARYLVLWDGASAKRARLRRIDAVQADFIAGAAALPAKPDARKPDARKPDARKPDARVVRLAFFLRHLGDPDRLVAASVSREFSDAPYAALSALRPVLDLERLKEALGAGRTVQHRGLVFLLVAILGTKPAGELLRSELARPETRDALGFDGLIGACVLLDGERGLAAVLAHRPPRDAPERARRWFGRCLTIALDFHGRLAGVLGRDVVLRELHALLGDDATAPMAVEVMTVLEDWAARPRVLALREDAGRWLRQACDGFLKSCPLPKSDPAPDGERLTPMRC